MSYTPDTKKYGADGSGPKVSIVMPLYNHERYVEEAIDSVLGQSFKDIELIVINDGSSDNSENRVNRTKDDRIRYFSQENQGASSTINRGIEFARGTYVSILNSDDVYDSNRIEECLNMLESDNSLSAVFSHLEFIDEKGDFIKYLRGSEENWLNHSVETSFKGENNILLDLLAGNFLVTTSNLFCKKEVFDEIGYFLNLKYAHDYDFFLRLCYRFKVHLIERPLVKYRIHSMNTVKENEAAVNFEVGLILTNFFLRHDLQELYKREDDLYSVMVKYYNSLNTYNVERMIMILLLFGMKYPEITDGFYRGLRENIESPFGNVCIAHIQNKINDWRSSQELLMQVQEAREEAKKWWLNSQEAWKKVEETGLRLTETEEARAIMESTLKETKDQLLAVIHSISFRLGRVLTWPVRKLRGIKVFFD